MLLTTKGRRDVVLLIDAPKLLPKGWRFDAFVGREQQLATPYFGIGNETVNDTTLSDAPDDYYYRYGKTQLRVLAQRRRLCVFVHQSESFVALHRISTPQRSDQRASISCGQSRRA